MTADPSAALAAIRAEWTDPACDLVEPEWPLRLLDALDAVLGLADDADEAHEKYLAGVILDRFIVPSNVTTARLRAAITEALTRPTTED